jgi:ABC-type branched-subunit amino acid transport system permease subunit
MSAYRSSTGFCVVVAIGLALLFGLPQVLSLFGIVQMTVFMAMAMYALSQGFVWGYGGIMSFGQASFLGLGAYAYAVSALNFGDTTGAIALAILVPAAFAALLGYFMFYGRISDAYIGVITLTVSVILFELVNSTSGDQYRIGRAAIGGFNGIPAVPAINIPGEPGDQLDPIGIWYVTMGLLIAVYVLLRAVVASRFGRVVIAIRENETRATLLGYDPRLYKLLAFTLAAAIAGLAGCLYVNWGAFISPTIFGLPMSAEVIIFVLVGGLGTLIGPILGAVGLQYLITLAGTQEAVNPNLGLGIVLVGFVLLVPQGVVPLLRDRLCRVVPRRGTRQTALPETAS